MIVLSINLIFCLSLCQATEDRELKPITAQQSSTYGNGSVEKAIDGNVSTICHTEKYPRPPWFRLYFNEIVFPSKIVVINGKENRFVSWLNNAEVSILTLDNSK